MKRRTFYVPYALRYDANGDLAVLSVTEVHLTCDFDGSEAFDVAKTRYAFLPLTTYFEIEKIAWGTIQVTPNGARGSKEAQLCQRFFGHAHSFGDGTLSGATGCSLVVYDAGGNAHTTAPVVTTRNYYTRNNELRTYVVDNYGKFGRARDMKAFCPDVAAIAEQVERTHNANIGTAAASMPRCTMRARTVRVALHRDDLRMA